MAVLDILQMGHPQLLETAQPITQFGTPELHGLVSDMQDTMRAHDGAGLAAPQIGVSLRLVVFGIENNDNPRYPDADSVPQTVLINPEITPLSNTVEMDWEGCLSIPHMRGLVPRYTQIQYRGFDLFGKPIEVTAEGFHARVVQHECDHLNGILYPFRIEDLRYFGFTHPQGLLAAQVDSEET